MVCCGLRLVQVRPGCGTLLLCGLLVFDAANFEIDFDCVDSLVFLVNRGWDLRSDYPRVIEHFVDRFYCKVIDAAFLDFVCLCLLQMVGIRFLD